LEEAEEEKNQPQPEVEDNEEVKMIRDDLADLRNLEQQHQNLKAS
jgi:hypothetical protein